MKSLFAVPHHRLLRGVLSFAVLAVGALLLSSCARPAMMPGSADRGYIIYGHIWQAEGEGAEEVTVYLVDDAYDQPVATVVTDFFGKFAFAYHPPGRYRVESGEHMTVVDVNDGDIEVDLDLSKPPQRDPVPVDVPEG